MAELNSRVCRSGGVGRRDRTANPEKAVWDWLPKEKRQELLERAFAAVKRHNELPAGEDFCGEHGDPYTDAGQFAEELAEEFRERLFELLGLRDAEVARGGRYFLLGELSAERVQVARK
ncbi:hypothetical protein [Pseudorhodoferax sp.]|uniref:hypothetical protein n=1 Tax=Pseudorhodoferax sp. TaxID=1993553 RepID=UPI0039E65ABD